MHEIINWLGLFVLLILGHCVADMGLQTEAITKGKKRNRDPSKCWIPEGQKYYPCWRFFLSGHGMIHGFVTICVFIMASYMGIYSGDLGFIVWIGAEESILHTLIDFLKGENVTNPPRDQLLHYLCKGLYIALAIMMVGI
jgi:hypothetical protein